MFFDWRQFHLSNATTPAVVDPRRRMRICLAGFAAALLLVLGRAVQLEVTQGQAFGLKLCGRSSITPCCQPLAAAS